MSRAEIIDADRRVAAEVLELGEALVDALLDAVANHRRAETSEPLPENELRTAASEFFQTLRVLLDPKPVAQERSGNTTH